MRVLHWYPNFLGGGGVANAVLGLALGQERAGADVRVAAADEGGQPVYGENERAAELVLSWKPRWRRTVGPLVVRGIPRNLRDEVRRFAPDVVHAHAEFNPDNVRALRIASRGVPVVLSPQGAFDPAVFQKSRERSKRLYARVARDIFYRRLGSFHALSPREAVHVQTVAPGCRTYVLPQGGGPAAEAAGTPSARSGIGERPAELLFVGRLDVYTKSLDLLVSALGNVLRKSPDSARLTLVGPDWRGGRGQLEARVRDAGVTSVVTFAGALPGADVARMIDGSDCVVLPSRHEGFSLTATEALVRGKPLILSRETGHASYPEIAAEPHVLLIAPDSAEIARAIVSFCERKEDLAQEARTRQPMLGEYFSWDRIGARHLEIYDSLASAVSEP